MAVPAAPSRLPTRARSPRSSRALDFASALVLASALVGGLAAAQGGAPGNASTPAACPPAPDLVAIPAVQGAGERSPRTSERVTVQGVVVASFLGRDQLGGVFLQDPLGDGDPATSDAVFVKLRSADLAFIGDRDGAGEPAPGDVLQVTGTVLERNAMTTVDRLTNAVRCGQAALPDAVAFALPLASDQAWERWEGMRVASGTPLTITEVYDLGRYGRVTLAATPLTVASQRPTSAATSAAGDVADGRARRSIDLDDASSAENRDPPPFLHPDGLPARVGDRLHDVEAVVVSEGLGAYRLEPLRAPTLERANPRPTTPPPVGVAPGDAQGVRVAALNVFNLFTSIPGRGARSEVEIVRQRDKLVSALVGLDADVVGLMEVENDGGRTLRALVDALNDRLGEERYAAVPLPERGLGTDAIAQALVYRRDRLVVTSTTNDPSAVHDRPPLAATFRQLASGERFSVIVVHFKSKGSCPAAGDVDTGSGCWSLRRAAQMSAAVTFAERVASAAEDDDVVIVGDLNAYAAEPPLRVALLAGWHDLGGRLPDAERYSYVYFGERGTLDYALASPSLAAQVTGFAYWHVNADEAPLLNYFTSYNPPAAYRPDAFRASDHDPLLVGIRLGAPSAP